jgi:hypothetical protein
LLKLIHHSLSLRWATNCLTYRMYMSKLNHPKPNKACHLLTKLEDNLLYLHLVKEIVTFQSLGKRHDLLKHEAEQMLLCLEFLKCFFEYRTNRAATHLNSQVLVICLVACPRNLSVLVSQA